MPVSPPRFRRIWLLLALLFGLAPWLLAAVNCSHCGRTIPAGSQYLRKDGKAFCSQRCLDATLPRCAACGKPCLGGFVKQGKRYCSQPCLETTFPQCRACGRRAAQGSIARSLAGEERFFCPDCIAGPRCFCCRLPGANQVLPDGRHLCRECGRTAVDNHAAMLAVAEEVRRRMRDELDLGTDHAVSFALVDEPTLHARSTGRHPGRELGLYRHEQTVEKTTRSSTRGGRVVSKTVDERVAGESHEILLLSHLSLAKLREVVAHELAHSWMQERYPGIVDEKVKEGWAEHVAAQVNALYGQGGMNRRMEANPDPVYGDGYRWVRQVVEQEGREGLFRRFAEFNQAGAAPVREARPVAAEQ